jgi:hypothetical protein
LWTRQQNFRFHKMFENSWAAERLAASKEQLGSMQLDNIITVNTACKVKVVPVLN